MFGAALAATLPLTLAPGAATAQEETMTMQEHETLPGWNALVETLDALPARMLDKLTPEQRADPQVRQELTRIALSALANATLNALGQDGDHPVFMPAIGEFITIGQPNADTVYRTASITPGGTYRLRGKGGNLAMARLAQIAPRKAGATTKDGMPDLGGPRKVFDLGALPLDEEGRFDVIASPQRPEGHEGAWWKLEPETHSLMLRLVSSDWAAETDPTLSIERLDIPVRRPRPAASELRRRLDVMPGAITFSATMFLDHVSRLREEGFVNRLKVFDVSQSGGLEGQFYYEGAYELAPGEALVLEARVPDTCAYHSVILTNDLYETIEWTNTQSSLNGAQSSVDADGILRVIIAGEDPGFVNWVDTAGYPTGVVQGRWTECSAQPVPRLTKIQVSDLASVLPEETPRITPQEREQIIRDRRAAYQQRPHW